MRRLGGDDRYATAAAMAAFVGEVGTITGPGGVPTAILTRGDRFAGAVMAGPLAAVPGRPSPLLLTAAGALPEPTRGALEELAVEQVLIIGSTHAVSRGVAKQVRDLGLEVARVEGANRLATATAVAQYAVDELGFDTDRFVLARGDVFADALAAGPLAGRGRDPLLLTSSVSALGADTAAYLRGHCGRVDRLLAIGSTRGRIGRGAGGRTRARRRVPAVGPPVDPPVDPPTARPTRSATGSCAPATAGPRSGGCRPTCATSGCGWDRSTGCTAT